MTVCLSSVYAGYHLNSSSGSTATDLSGNGRHGTLVNMEDGDWVAGKLNNCLHFIEGGEYITCGDIGNFDYDDTFSIEAWIKMSSDSKYIVSRRDNSLVGWGVWIDDGKVWFILCNDYTDYQVVVKSDDTINDGVWHHVIITYSGTGTGSGVHIYIDNVDADTTISQDNLGGRSITNSADFNIGTRANKTSGIAFTGYLDEVIIYNTVLSADDVSFRWNGGAGTETFIDNPPNAPSNPNPTDTEADVEYNRDLSWSCTHPDGVDMEYDVYLDTVTPPVNKVASDITITSYSPANYNSLQTYYWQIVAKDDCGNETSGPTWSFTTRNESPITPNTPSPVNHASNEGLSVTLSWSSGDYNPDDTVTYDIYFGTASNPPKIKTDHTGTTYALPPLSYDTRYYWKIVARDSNGAETAGPIWYFNTQEEGLGGYTGFDIRETIRSHFCSVEYKPGSELTEYYFKVEDDIGDDIHIPMYLSEEVRSKEMKEMPFLDMGLAMTTFEPCDIAAASRKKEAYVDIGLWYTDTDNIDRTEFGNNIIDKLIDYIRSNQCNFTNIDFINVEDVRLLRETRAHQVVYHWIITVYCVYWDLTN